jgi:hypothetical protein
MWSTFTQRVKWIKKYLFEILTILSVIFILVLAIFRIGKTGTWNTDYYFPSPALPIMPNGEPRKDSQGEIRTRAFLERYFKQPFPKSRPDFMVNPVTGSRHNLELDCYNDQLRLAVEYNGAQHYKYIPYFHKNKEAFYNQKYRDELKRLRCKELGIVLIDIPYTENKNLERYLEEQLRIHGFYQR